MPRKQKLGEAKLETPKPEAPNARVDNTQVQVWEADRKGRKTLIRTYSESAQPGSNQGQRKEWAESFASKKPGRSVEFVILT